MANTVSLDTLNDRALLHQFGELVRQDHEAIAALLRHIDAIDRRQLWAKLGHPSLFDFLVVRRRAHNAFEADRDYGVGFMARQRQRNAPEECLKVREPVARYVVHRVTNDEIPPLAPWCSVASGALPLAGANTDYTGLFK